MATMFTHCLQTCLQGGTSFDCVTSSSYWRLLHICSQSSPLHEQIFYKMTRFIDRLVLFTCMAVLINGGVTAPKGKYLQKQFKMMCKRWNLCLIHWQLGSHAWFIYGSHHKLAQKERNICIYIYKISLYNYIISVGLSNNLFPKLQYRIIIPWLLKIVHYALV